MAASPSSSPFAGLQLLPTLEFSTEGSGGAFGPTSFDGFPIAAGFTLHRAASHPPTQEQEARMKLPPDHKDALGAAYSVQLWVRFQVEKPLDPPDWESESMQFEHYWGLGAKTGQTHYVADFPDFSVPKGLTGGFQELKHLTQGVFDIPGSGKAVLTLGEEKGGVYRDLSEFRGRWYQPQPDTTDAKKKLFTNSGFMQFLTLSAPAVAALDPSAVMSKTEVDPKTNLSVTVQQLKIWPVNDQDQGGLAPDGGPWGALFFVGLKGRWDTKKTTIPGKNGGRSFEQKVLYMTSYEGRVMVSQTATPTTAQAPAQTAQAPQQAPISAPTTSTPAAPMSGGNLDDLLTALILEVLPSNQLPDGSNRYQGETLTQLGLKVAQAGNARKAFGDSPNMLEIVKALGVLVRKAPTPEDAAMASAMGEKVPFAFNVAQSIVERVG